MVNWRNSKWRKCGTRFTNESKIFPFSQSSRFLDLLNSQQYESLSPSIALGSSEVHVFSSQWTDDPSQAEHTLEDRRGRRNWSPKENVVLISAWLNTSKYPVVGNEQKAEAFWKCIAAYFAASSKLAGMQKREAGHCKQMWRKINDQVCKFVGCLEAATSQKSSGQNENDVIKLANQIYLNDHGVKFTLEHCWRELRHDKKWCAASSTTDNGKSKRRKCDDGPQASAQSSSSYTVSHGDQAPTQLAKAKRTIKGVEEEDKVLKEFQSMWKIKQKDFELNEKLSKHNFLESFLEKTEPLSDIEMALKNKLITDILSNA